VQIAASAVSPVRISNGGRGRVYDGSTSTPPTTTRMTNACPLHSPLGSQVIDPVTPEHGYTYGGAIIGGRSTGGVALAGGICSTSTTLFNTALRAGLEMGARLNHYYYIDRYPVGLDATVYATDYWSQSMSFTNDTEGPLIIRSFTGWGMVRFDLWGLPTNRAVTFTTPIITNRTYAGDTIEYTSSLRTGTSLRVEYPHHGFDVTVTRIVRDATSGEVIHEDTYDSSYKTVDGITLVGTG